ncbi:MAG: photosystem II manganese-stabilizing polypeptide [Thermostichales cyanobacterium SZTDM-1c_bins_54]
MKVSRLWIVVLMGLAWLTWQTAAAAQQKLLTYDQVVGTGQAALCPQLPDSARGKIEVPAGKVLKLTDVCFQPIRIEVEEEKRNGEKEFLETKMFIPSGATLGPIKAEVRAIPEENALALDVVDGITQQPTTVQLPRRERIALLFSVRRLHGIAKGSATSINPSTDFEGDFEVPGYHMSTFLDPRARGSGTGYEVAVGLQAAQDEFATNKKVDEIASGHLSLRIARVDSSTGELAGSFVSLQPSSTEQGALEPKTVRIQGLFYGRVDS